MEDYNDINSFPRPNLPNGFRALLFALSKEVLREQPTNLYEFCAEFFGQRLLSRGDSWISFKELYNERKKERMREETKLKSMPDPITETTDDLFPGGFTAEQEEAVVKIQAGVRGMLTRRITRPDDKAQTERERWLNPREQLQRDLHTVSDSISFAQLESDDGEWEACQRWLRPTDQLRRDVETAAEPVECAHLRDRYPSLEEASLDVGASASLEDHGTRALEQQQRSAPAETVSPQHSDIDVAGEVAPLPDTARADSPPELASPVHSAISVASATGAPPTPPARGPSIASVLSVQHSDVSLAAQAPAPAHDPNARARSLEALSAEHVTPPSHPTTSPSPPTDVLNQPTASSQLDLASAAPPAAGAEQRAGSPAEVTTPRHSDVELAEASGGGREAGRAGSPPEAISPAHSDVDEPGGEVH